MRPSFVYILIAVFLVCGCATREPNRPLVRYKHFQLDAKPPVLYFTQPLPPVPLNEINRVEFWHVVYGTHRHPPGELETLFVVTNSDDISEMYDSLRVYTSTNSTAPLCGYIAHQRWLDSSSNVLFRTSLLNCFAEITAKITTNERDLAFFGTNPHFARVVRDLMAKHAPDLLARRRAGWEEIKSEAVKREDTFWGEHGEPNQTMEGIK